MKNIKLTEENLGDLQTALDYLIESEKKSYEECFADIAINNDNDDFIFDKTFYSSPEINHIYAIARRTKDVIEIF